MNSVGILEHIKVSPQHKQNKHETVKEPFGSFTDRILDQCNYSFGLMYYKIFKKYWHTSLDARMPRNYAVTNREQGIYEVYFPTQASLDRNMQYFRIVVKVVEEVDNTAGRQPNNTLAIREVSPNGTVDSELICIIAPRRSEKARREQQFIRGFRHVNKPGYLTAIVINPIPEICMKRLLTIIAKFLKTRLTKLLEKLKIEPWQYDYRELKDIYYSKLTYRIEGFCYHIAQTLRTFSHSLSWILDHLKGTMREIGRQSMLRTVVNKFFTLKDALKEMEYGNPKLIAELEADLIAKVKGCYWVKKPLPRSEWVKRVPKVTVKLTPLEAAILRIDTSQIEGVSHG